MPLVGVMSGALGYGLFAMPGLPAIGENIYGGYFAGVIDTTRAGSIQGNDQSQTGARYMLIVSPKSLEVSNLRWLTSNSSGPTGVQTRWDGLTSTVAMANAGTGYEAATYAHNLTFPSDGGSRWYLPALDELSLCYVAFKPMSINNNKSPIGGNGFPHSTSVTNGNNISSLPSVSGYINVGFPLQTNAAAFQTGGAQAFEVNDTIYWTATEDSPILAWNQSFSGSGGAQSRRDKRSRSTYSPGTVLWVRPVRRIIF